MKMVYSFNFFIYFYYFLFTFSNIQVTDLSFSITLHTVVHTFLATSLAMKTIAVDAIKQEMQTWNDMMNEKRKQRKELQQRLENISVGIGMTVPLETDHEKAIVSLPSFSYLYI